MKTSELGRWARDTRHFNKRKTHFFLFKGDQPLCNRVSWTTRRFRRLKTIDLVEIDRNECCQPCDNALKFLERFGMTRLEYEQKYGQIDPSNKRIQVIKKKFRKEGDSKILKFIDFVLIAFKCLKCKKYFCRYKKVGDRIERVDCPTCDLELTQIVMSRKSSKV